MSLPFPFSNYNLPNDAKYLRQLLNYDANQVFRKINTRLFPEIILIGIPFSEPKPTIHSKKNSHQTFSDDSNKYDIILEPEDSEYLTSTINQILTISKELERLEVVTVEVPEPQAAISNSMEKAVEIVFESIQKDSSKKLFFSTSIIKENFHFQIILSLLAEEYNQMANPKASNTFNNESKFIFVNAIIHTYLKHSIEALRDPTKGDANGVIRKSYDDLLKEAGMIYTNKLLNPNSWTSILYENLNSISTLKYEGSDGFGKIIFAKRDDQRVDVIYELRQEIRLSEFRKARKFIEMSDNLLHALVDDNKIYGLGNIRTTSINKLSDPFVVSFVSHYKWEISHQNDSLMTVAYGIPSILRNTVDRNKFASDVNRIFKNKNDVNLLWDVASAAVRQHHGTMLVITDKAEEEAERLGGQCFKIFPKHLSDEYLLNLTSIDGALIVDATGLCYAFGVILDGIATEKGDSARGARYNSALRYYEQAKRSSSLMIIIVSEDGMIDIVPNLKPKIDHSEIKKAIKIIQSMVETSKIDAKTFHRNINFLEKSEFYLTGLECDVININQKIINDKLNEDEIAIFRYDRKILKPNEDMNDSYYL